ncbi:MAG: ABC transporter ATP-binding protein [Rickettsiales bacterium]|jgi:putative ABC transport system ATP-binding protein|nr:ABC transporter ATP-binding protein [Rickettsiales bacterium]
MKDHLEPFVIHMDNVCKEFPLYGGDVQKVLFNISINIRSGEFVAIMGPSGSGKSTLMNIIGALDTASSGTYKLYGLPIEDMEPDDLAVARNEYIGFVFQNFNLLTKRGVLDNVMLPLMYRGLSVEERQVRAREMLRQVGLERFENHLPNQLSGGMKQRVAIARALAGSPKMILADEPTGALDSKMGNDVLKFLKKLNGELGMTIVMITHEFEIAQYAERLIHIRDGHITYDGKMPASEEGIK